MILSPSWLIFLEQRVHRDSLKQHDVGFQSSSFFPNVGRVGDTFSWEKKDSFKDETVVFGNITKHVLFVHHENDQPFSTIL